MGKTAVVIGLVFAAISIIISLIIFFVGGVNSFLKFFLWYIIAIGVVVILFLIILVVWWIFQPQKIDAVKLNKKRILKSALLNSPTTETTIYFRGTEEWEYKEIGLLKGVCRIQIKKTKIVNKKKIIKEDTEDALVFKKRAGILNFFLPYQIIRVTKEERTSLNADKIFLKGMSFTPELFGFLYLPSRFRDPDENTKTAAEEIRRYTAQEVLKEEINIVNDAIAISPRHQKELEKQNLTGIQSVQQPPNK